MLVSDLMTKDVITVKPSTTVEEVAGILHRYHFTGVPVVSDDNTLMGVIMERDFITADSKLYLPTYIKLLKDIDFIQNDKKRLSQAAMAIVNATAADIMNPSIVVARADMTLQKLAELFATKRVNPIPVVDEHMKLIGVISRSDLIKLFSPREVEEAAERLPRPVDENLAKAYKDIDTHFAFVSKTRAAIWFMIALACMFIGFLLGVSWVIAK